MNTALEWVLETLENDKELKIIMEVDTFGRFFGYLYVNHFKVPYLDILYLYEFVGSTNSDGDYLSTYNIYIVITTAGLPGEFHDWHFSNEEKEALLNFIKSRIQ
ncbi:MAG: hypothetical protein QW607_07840 [Desulfurococcaceae archaeon]